MAAHFGLYEAIILQFLNFVRSEDSDGKVLEDGHRYCYNTYADWKKLYPFISERTLQRTLTSMEEKALICSKQPDGYNRQKYYRISEWTVTKDAAGFFDKLPSCQNGELEPSCQIGTMEDAKVVPCTIVHKSHETIPAINAGELVLRLDSNNTPQTKKRGRPSKPTDPRYVDFVKIWCDLYQRRFGKNYGFMPKDGLALKFLLSRHSDLTTEHFEAGIDAAWNYEATAKSANFNLIIHSLFDLCNRWNLIVAHMNK